MTREHPHINQKIEESVFKLAQGQYSCEKESSGVYFISPCHWSKSDMICLFLIDIWEIAEE